MVKRALASTAAYWCRYGAHRVQMLVKPEPPSKTLLFIMVASRR
jgi:hypothetical protein